jgi:hypothetical protein
LADAITWGVVEGEAQDIDGRPLRVAIERVS